MEKLLGPGHNYTRHALYELSTCYSRLGRLDEADEMFTKTQDGQEYDLNLGDLRPFNAARRLGDQHMERGNLEKAEKLCIYAYDGTKKLRGKDDHDTMEILYTLAFVYIKTNRREEAESMFRRVLVLYEDLYGPRQRAQVFRASVDDLSSFFTNTAITTNTTNNNTNAINTSNTTKSNNNNTTGTTTEVQESPRAAPQFPKSIAALKKVIEPGPQSSSENSYWPTWMCNLISLNRSKPTVDGSRAGMSSGEKNEKDGG